MWGWLKVILEVIGGIFTDIFNEAMKTPAIEVSVENAEGILENDPTPDHELLDRYKWVHARD